MKLIILIIVLVLPFKSCKGQETCDLEHVMFEWNKTLKAELANSNFTEDEKFFISQMPNILIKDIGKYNPIKDLEVKISQNEKENSFVAFEYYQGETTFAAFYYFEAKSDGYNVTVYNLFGNIERETNLHLQKIIKNDNKIKNVDCNNFIIKSSLINCLVDKIEFYEP